MNCLGILIAADIAFLILTAVVLGCVRVRGRMTILATIAAVFWKKCPKEGTSMLPKDLLNYLEKGDHALEDLKMNEEFYGASIPGMVMGQGLAAHWDSIFDLSPMSGAQLANSHNHSQSLQNVAQANQQMNGLMPPGSIFHFDESTHRWR